MYSETCLAQLAHNIWLVYSPGKYTLHVSTYLRLVHTSDNTYTFLSP